MRTRGNNIPYLLGLDIGTSGTKVKLFSRDGFAVTYCWREHPANLYLGNGVVEQDPEVWWAAVRTCLRHVTKHGDIQGIRAVGITGIGLTTVLLGRGGRILRRSILYSDTRHRRFGREIRNVVGNPGYGTLKHFGDILWTMKNEGVAGREISVATDALGFVGFKLTGTPAYDKFLMPEQQVARLSSELDMTEDCFGVPHGYTDVVGTISANAARETGLPKGLPVVIGPWDGMCNIIGSGLTKEGLAVDVAGSTEIIAAITSHKPRIMNLPHIIPGLFFTYTSPHFGTMHRWLVNNFFDPGPTGSVYERFERKSKLAPLGSDGLLFVPCGASRRQRHDPTASFVGLSPRHTMGHIARAVLEGIAFAVRNILDQVEKAGVSLTEVRISGGGSKSDFWTQIRADVTGRRFVKLRESETGCLGAAMLAGIGSGVYADVLDATHTTVKTAKVFVPDANKHKVYEKLYAQFVRASEKLC